MHSIMIVQLLHFVVYVTKNVFKFSHLTDFATFSDT